MVESSPAVTGMDRNGRHRPERIVPEGHPSSESAVTLAEILPPNHISARPNPLQRKVPSPCRSPFPVTPARRHDQIPAILFPAAYLPPFRPSLASRASVAQTPGRFGTCDTANLEFCATNASLLPVAPSLLSAPGSRVFVSLQHVLPSLLCALCDLCG